MSEPIKVYESQEQLDASLKEWQERLGLMNWHVQAVLVDYRDMPEKDALGYCWQAVSLRVAKISISRFDDDILKGELIKPCHEKILVHELLHILLPAFEYEHESESTVFKSDTDHYNVELLARALISAKYGVNHDWFKNF